MVGANARRNMHSSVAMLLMDLNRVVDDSSQQFLTHRFTQYASLVRHNTRRHQQGVRQPRAPRPRQQEAKQYGCSQCNSRSVTRDVLMSYRLAFIHTQSMRALPRSTVISSFKLLPIVQLCPKRKPELPRSSQACQLMSLILSHQAVAIKM